MHNSILILETFCVRFQTRKYYRYYLVNLYNKYISSSVKLGQNTFSPNKYVWSMSGGSTKINKTWCAATSNGKGTHDFIIII